MLHQGNTSEEILKDFHSDTMLWKSLVGYMEKEAVFLGSLLNTGIYQDVMTDHDQRFKNYKTALETKTKEIHLLKNEVLEYEDELRGILECEDIYCDTFYMENHTTFKQRFEQLFIAFNDYKVSVFQYVGNIL
ncbi:hypothetical protein HCG49_04320 [Arenibacter sp. 6A1]|uniref:hypothetical protein n=1 Tax=Arenibacter sp. 6A1 TaxID=2720391 RepID=UPI001445F6F8|nr:hypothetical protein [Arenibacter sp. 6A1]NKI25783.1 hypothetical protein [Arenibacter sp. 6A1]